jgi:hypothetical protein
VVPIINLEWIQKLHRDKTALGYSREAIVETILRRMPDYIHYICPQFSRTHEARGELGRPEAAGPGLAWQIGSAGRRHDPVQDTRAGMLLFPRSMVRAAIPNQVSAFLLSRTMGWNGMNLGSPLLFASGGHREVRGGVGLPLVQPGRGARFEGPWRDRP